MPALLTTQPSARKPAIAHYSLTLSGSGGGWETLESVDARTGVPCLPILFDRVALIPKCLDAEGEFLKEVEFLGRRYLLEGGNGEAILPINPPQKSRRIALDGDVLIGTSRNFRNARPGRRYVFGPDYEYAPFTQADYERMADAGINFFDRITPQQYVWVRRLPAFFVVDVFEKDQARIPFPEVLYHPGFLGVEDFVDEPSYLMSQGHDAPPRRGLTLEIMAQALERRVRRLYTVGGEGRGHTLAERLQWAGIDVPPAIDTPAERLPIWEEHFSTACYQLRQGGAGFIHEGRYDFPYVTGILNETYRTRIPMRPRSTFLIYFAFLRGAARLTGKDWGTSIYGQADPTYAPMALRMAYDRGARYLWFWTSDKSHHLPFEDQIALASDLRDYMRSHPRGARRALIRAADAAIVLPYGFTFAIDDYNKRRVPDLWHDDAFPLDGGRLPSGVSYYAVLRAAARRMEQMIRAGREFDVVIDVPELKDAGYRELFHVLDDAAAATAEFPRWVLFKEKALVGLLGLYVISAALVGLAGRRSKGLEALLRGTRARTFGAPWRLVLPWALALALKHHVLTLLTLENMHMGPQRHDWVTGLYTFLVIALGLAAAALYWRKHLRRNGLQTGMRFLAMSLLAFALEYDLFLWLGREDIIA